MLGFITDTIEDTVGASYDALNALADGDLPSRKDVATLISAGLTVTAISEATGIAEGIIQGLAE